MKVEALLEDANQMLECWEEIRALTFRAVETQAEIGSDHEQAFLDLKSSLSRLQRSLSQDLPPYLNYEHKKVAELLKQSVSLQHLRAIPETERATHKAATHDVLIQLLRVQGGLEFLAAGWRPAPPKKKKTGSKKKAKQKQMMIGAAVLAAAAAGYYFFFM